MIYLDGFSGYGGFRLGFERAGWKFDKVYFSEIDKYAIANYKYNFQDSEYVGSITDVRDIGKIDLFTFGWPCQDNSIAGKRKGQSAGTRSGLLFHAVSCIDRFKPRNFVAENVGGLYSVNEGNDIIEAFRVLTFLNDSCPQYDIEMQLFNTRFHGIPHNRPRLFFVGHLRGSGSKRIFPIGQRIGAADEVEISLRPRTNLNPIFNITMPESARRDIAGSHSIRDLTPVEYERLQGLPDDWTKYGIIKEEVKELAKGHRYKLSGNGVSIPVIKAIAEKLKINSCKT